MRLTAPARVAPQDRQPCLVFDLDDTLFLEREYVHSGFTAVGDWVWRNLGVPDFAGRAWRLFEQGHRGRVFDTLLRDSGCDPVPLLINQLVYVYRSHVPQISILPDAMECLSFFRRTALLALITDGPAIAQRRKVEALELGEFFDVVVFTDEWGRNFAKPHARAFQLVQSRLRPSDGRFLYVADNPEKDFIAPAALGWTTVRVRRPQGLHSRTEAPSGAGADVEMRDLAKLREFVCQK